MCVAHGAQDFGLREEFAYGVEKLVGEFLSSLSEEAREVVALEMLPEPFDGIEVRAVGGQELRLDVVPLITSSQRNNGESPDSSQVPREIIENPLAV